MQRAAVIGLGRFGTHLARVLFQRGLEVIAVDRDPDRVAELEGDVSLAVTLDATNEEALRQADIHTVDFAVVSIGEAVEQSQLVTRLLKQIGLERVISRAHTDARELILSKLGADEVVRPESESATRLGQRLAFRFVEDVAEMGHEIRIVRMKAPKKFHGKTIGDLDVRRKFKVTIVGLRSAASLQGEEEDSSEFTIKDGDGGDLIECVPSADHTIHPGDTLFLIGLEEDLKRLPQPPETDAAP